MRIYVGFEIAFSGWRRSVIGEEDSFSFLF